MDKVNFMCYPVNSTENFTSTENFYNLTNTCKEMGNAPENESIKKGFEDKSLVFSPNGPAWCQFGYRGDMFPTTFKKDAITTLIIPGINELKINTSNIPNFASNQTYGPGSVVKQKDAAGKESIYLCLVYSDPRGSAYSGAYQWDPNGDSKIIWKKIFLI
jgi:hypothetical protein